MLNTPELGHGKAAPGWFFWIAGVAVDFVSAHGMELLSAAAICVGIGYHLVLIHNARESHRLDLEERKRRQAYPWNGFPFQNWRDN